MYNDLNNENTNNENTDTNNNENTNANTNSENTNNENTSTNDNISNENISANENDNNGNISTNGSGNDGSINYTLVQDVEFTTDDPKESTSSNDSASWQSGEGLNGKKEKKRKHKNGAPGKSYVAIALICSILGGGIGTGVTYGLMHSNAQILPNETKKSTTNNLTTNLNSIAEMSIPEIVAKVSPAVVGVSTTSVAVNQFGFNMGEQEGVGSGFIFSEDGYVLTNYHVVKNASQVKVTLSTGKEVNAKVVNYQEDADLAVVKITDDIKMPGIVELGDSDTLQAGEQVIAIGNPLGLDYLGSVTTGIISSVSRDVAVSEDGKTMNLIQTDTAINPGNSGGPLINSRGQVIGINTAKIQASGVEGIGFSIPINNASDKLETLVQQKIKLGIGVVNITDDLSKQYKLPVGVYIQTVENFSIAQKGGLQSGDVITKIGRKGVKTVEELNEIKATYKVGDSIEIEYVRNGETMTTNLKAE